MTGAEHLTAEAADRTHRAAGEIALQVPGLTRRAGELVGLAGLEGHGQDVFLQSLRGGESVAYVPRERRAESLFESKSIRENFGIATMDRDRSRGLLSAARTRARLAEYVDRLQRLAASCIENAQRLASGNDQPRMRRRGHDA